MVIDENLMDTGPIPEHFLNYIDEDEITDYIPTHRTTTSTTSQWPPTTTLAPPQQASTTNATTMPADESTGQPTMTPMPMTTTSTTADEHVLDNQWFSDVDGGI